MFAPGQKGRFALRWFRWGTKKPKVSKVTASTFVARLVGVVEASADSITSIVLSYDGSDKFIVDWKIDTMPKTKHFRIRTGCPHCVMQRALRRVANLVGWSNRQSDELAAAYESGLRLGVQINVHFIRPQPIGEPEADAQQMLAYGWHHHRMVCDASAPTSQVCGKHRDLR